MRHTLSDTFNDFWLKSVHIADSFTANHDSLLRRLIATQDSIATNFSAAMKSKYFTILSIWAICYVHLCVAQNSNSTSGGFMSQVNSWISRLRGTHNNKNNSDNGDKKEEKKTVLTPPMPYPGMVPYPMMPGIYTPNIPMVPQFGPRPIGPSGYAPAIAAPAFGSMTAGSSMGPSIGTSIGSPITPNFSPLNPNYAVGSASHLLP